MPELPEVETTRRALEARLSGARIDRVEVRRRDLRRPVPAELPELLAGRRLVGFGRRGKYLLVDTDGPVDLLVHLGMSGRLLLDAAADHPHAHVVLCFAGGRFLSFVDPRRFGLIEPLATGQAEGHPLLAGLGPEPLDPGFRGEVLRRAFAGRAAPVKNLLLDQRVVAGVGNIYACEALFEARIHPFTPAGELDGRACTRLARAIRAVLERAIGAGGSSLRDYVAADGRLGNFQNDFRVYDRAGLPCPRCGTAVVREARAGRSTFFCPRCQPERRPGVPSRDGR
ncbi:Formamidopyrimidine-DNA glycosylase [bacterium HR39]|nr:Formamidopyrimidine-DNA glycosylase [bacterium HR39]